MSKPLTLKIALLSAALAACPALVAPARAQVGVDISVAVAPPELPVYEQPPIPGPGYIWTPGYWAWTDGAYTWVPGLWVQPPEVGVLWTPPYWGWDDGVYLFHAGYWGPHVGFYGGIDYGFGYGGVGFEGGHWENGSFAYNRAVTNLGSTNITNVYNKTVEHNSTVRTSYNGGTGGVTAQPTAEQRQAASERHVPATAAQEQHVAQVARDPAARKVAAPVAPRSAAAHGPAGAEKTASTPHPEGRPAAESHAANQPHPAAEPRAVTQPHPVEARPVPEAHPARLPEARPAEAARPAEVARPAPARPAEARPAEPRPAEKRPEEKRPEEPPRAMAAPADATRWAWLAVPLDTVEAAPPAMIRPLDAGPA